MKLTKRERIELALHRVVSKTRRELKSTRSRENAATKRLDDDEIKTVRDLWAQVLRELPKTGNRLRFSRMRELLSKKAPKIVHPGKENFRNWLKARIPDFSDI